MIELTRRYGFPAAHVLSHPSLSDEENRRIYDKCANPAGHGHNYGFEVTVTGPVDERSGRIIDPALLDAIFEELVSSRFSHTLLNDDALFADRVPTAENIARVLHERLAGAIAERSSARLARVRVVETHRNFFSYGAMP